MSTQVIDRDRLGVLSKIGQGGQGVVYRAPNVKTKFAASMVYKEYKPQVLADIDFTALAAMPALVEESLTYPEAERLISIAAWPCRIVENAGAPTGFVMPAIPDQFVIELSTAKGATPTTAEFQHLLNHPSVLAARGISIDDVQRCTLLREVASGLAFMHKHGVCVGDISPKNLLFSLTREQAVYFIDCDAIRINGVSALPQVETPGWEVPRGEELATIYSDTYKLGLLALRLLAGDQDTKNPHHLPATTPTLLRQIITDTLTNDPHTRPLPEAWTYVLGHAIEETQHHKLTTPQQPAPATVAAAPPPTPTVRSRPPVSRPPGPPPPPQTVYSEPPVAPPAPPPSRSTLSTWAGVAVVAVVLIALVVAVKLTTNNNGTSSSAPQSSSAVPPGYSSSPPTSTSTPSETYATTVPPSPVASADVAGLAPFVGTWVGMRETVAIDSTGQAHFDYMDSAACQSCSMADMPYKTMDFVLTSVSASVASGSVTASSGTRNAEVGEPVTVALKPQQSGEAIEWTIGGKNEGLFCASAIASFCGG